MKAYCITCKETPERRPLAEVEFKRAGLDVEFVRGFHGATLGLAPTLSAFDSPTHKISAGKVGLFLSYLTLWRMIADRGDEVAFIVEDDVIFADDFRQQLAAVLPGVPAFDVLHVGHCCTAGKPARQVAPGVSEIKFPLCNHAAIWTRAAILAAIERINCVSSPLDVTLANVLYPSLRCFALTPPLAFQRGEENHAKRERESTTRVLSWQDIPIAEWFDYQRIYDEAIDRVKGPAVFVEVGSFKGRSTAYLAEEIKRRQKPIKFYACDTWTGTPGHKFLGEQVAAAGGSTFPIWRDNMQRAGVASYVEALPTSSPAAAAGFADGSIDFVWIDGDHSAAAVEADILAWWTKLKPGGIMAGHDIDMSGVRRSVDKLFPGTWRRWERCWISSPKRA